MGKRILIFNVIYYVIILFFVKLGREDASSSLGYGFFIIAFWAISAIVLVFFLIKKIIQPKSVLEKIGVFTATPVLSIAVVWLVLFVKDDVGSEWYFNKGNYRYKVRTINYKEALKVKRIEYYRNEINSNSTWVRDSTWLFFSESGDTIKRVRYRNDVEVK